MRMLTPWGEKLDRSNVLPEYPRPQMQREQWVNLNGPWAYAITDRAECPERFDGEILVPFSPETTLSGVEKTLQPGQFLWYRRRFADTRQKPGERTLLHFGAVDQCAEVFVNGASVGSHEGGYLPFTLDITDYLKEENELTLRVTDGTDSSYFARGKQKTKRGGIWYTPQSGIWQTVWMENVPKDFISGLTITPLFDEKRLSVTVHSAASLPCTVTAAGVMGTGMTNLPVVLPVPDCLPWSPEQPELYDLTALMGGDCVVSYFAMRKFSVGKDGAGVPVLMLNNEPYFHNGVLDQGYWPDGLYTAPSDEAMVYDIQLMKDMGFNMLRKHIKVEPLRWYYHCDRLGMLVWQDMINGGGAYKFLTITTPVFTGAKWDDHAYRRFAREDPEGREQYRRELMEMLHHLYNCPCIAMWVPFNEGWGQFEAAETAEAVRAVDPTRTIDHASGWHDQGAGDVKSLHVYFKPYRFKADALGRPVALTEFGGYARRIEGHCWSPKLFGYKILPDEAALTEAYRRLYENEIYPAIRQGLAATVYTQVSDVEDEVNGFVTYDRKEVKLPVEKVRKVNEGLHEAAREPRLGTKADRKGVRI